MAYSRMSSTIQAKFTSTAPKACGCTLQLLYSHTWAALMSIRLASRLRISLPRAFRLNQNERRRCRRAPCICMSFEVRAVLTVLHSVWLRARYAPLGCPHNLVLHVCTRMNGLPPIRASLVEGRQADGRSRLLVLSAALHRMTRLCRFSARSQGGVQNRSNAAKALSERRECMERADLLVVPSRCLQAGRTSQRCV